MPEPLPEKSLPQSKLGIASFVIPLAITFLFIVLLVVTAGRRGRPDAVDSVIGAWMMVGQPIGFLVGLVLGIVGLTRKGRRHSFAIAGVVLNGLVGLLVVALLIASLGAIVAH